MFVDPRVALNSMLDRYEARGPMTPEEQASGVPRIISRTDITGLKNLPFEKANEFEQVMRAAEKAGAVSLRFTSKFKTQVNAAHLTDVGKLYSFLSRTPAHEVAVSGLALLDTNANIASGTVYRAARAELLSAWGRNKKWRGTYTSADAEELVPAFLLAQAIVDGKHSNASDMRSFSSNVAQDSKALENWKDLVHSLIVKYEPDFLPVEIGSADEAFAYLGIEKVAQPLMLAGPLSILERSSLPYLGFPPDMPRLINFSSAPTAILTIENYTSFVRYAETCNPTRDNLVLYTGGFPSRRCLAFYKDAVERFPSADLYHWGDIDAGGLRILAHLRRNAPREIKSHQMTSELLRAHGSLKNGAPNGLEPTDTSVLNSLTEEEQMAELVRQGYWLEQEVLPPEPVPAQSGPKAQATD
ncbi:Wadjet anti-phage system protein JetD domain-containing protein [Thalassospira xiamenensis]|nr:Wadjet anti-phage system protein JetD domain-containing protein [Thalassospira xiamenensis]